jgi:hypothetical protein
MIDESAFYIHPSIGEEPWAPADFRRLHPDLSHAELDTVLSGRLERREIVRVPDCRHCLETCAQAPSGDFICRNPDCFLYAPEGANS